MPSAMRTPKSLQSCKPRPRNGQPAQAQNKLSRCRWTCSLRTGTSPSFGYVMARYYQEAPYLGSQWYGTYLFNLAQYSDETASLLARQLLDGATGESTIAVVSAPSVFVALKNLLAGFIYHLLPTYLSTCLPIYILYYLQHHVKRICTTQ